MPLKSVESQNAKFKSNLQDASHWPKARLERDEAVGNYKLKSRFGYW